MSKKSILKRTDHRAIMRIAVFGALTLASLAIFLFGMVSNSNGSVERFNALTAVDDAGGDVETALVELREYIYSHMNTELGGPNGIYPPIQLRGTYNRLVEAEEQRVSVLNEQVRIDADQICASRFPAGQIRQRADCNAEYIEQNSAEVKEIDDSFYKFNFVAPRWSPDFAGFGLLAAIMFGLLTIFNAFIHFRTRHMINSGN